ncbi:LacI family transcriptional regulator [Occultella glacieicola]|uniref:LacI family transcriptional regulator n=1 Tax=Occultella glacieicola TaxID=2518684 RepID=A0ABY2E3C7_9MICO|nr:LacI family DNA-binding transcriptional regulator [Occultella glacieicola]TDE89514.1 LacI family transcriptional regulator [Occultella glacieicola]
MNDGPAVEGAAESWAAPGEGAEARRPAKPTINDVAARAGVSKATVSKFLNVSLGYSVAPKTRARIEDAIRELDYHPSPIARSLTSGSSMTIGLVIADIMNPFFPDLVASLQSVVETRGYNLILGSSGRDGDREVEIIRSLIQRRVDGLILASVQGGSAELEFIEELGVPTVLASRDLPELLWDTVVIDNVQGAEIAVKHLRDLGHTRIGYVASNQSVKPFHDRLRGFEAATADLPDAVSVTVGSMMEDGRLGTHELLARTPRPTALHYANDVMALGGLVACAELALSVPWDVSIIGHDNISAGSLPGIGLTTVDSAAAWVGERAGELLLHRIGGPAAHGGPPQLVVRPAKLILRSSTAPPAEARGAAHA